MAKTTTYAMNGTYVAVSTSGAVAVSVSNNSTSAVYLYKDTAAPANANVSGIYLGRNETMSVALASGDVLYAKGNDGQVVGVE